MPMTQSGADKLAWWRVLQRVRADDRRRHARRKVQLPAKITLGDGSVHACTVRDIAEAGARIAIETPENLPDRFAVCMSPSGFQVRVDLPAPLRPSKPRRRPSAVRRSV